MAQTNPINSTINGIAISGTPSTGYVPTATSASAATWQAAAGGSSDPYHYISYPLFNTDEVTDAGSGDTIATFLGGIRGYQTTPATNEYAQWYSQIANKFLASNMAMTKLYGSVLIGPVGSTGSGIIYYHFLSTANDTTVTADHIGIQLDKVSGTTTPSSSTADGTTQQKVTLSITLGFTGDESFRYGFKYDGTTMSMYVNGTLKNTHSTNVPRTTSSQQYNYTNIYKATISTANAFSLLVNRFNLIIPITS